MAQITASQLRRVDAQTGATINKYRGVIPRGFVVACILAANDIAADSIAKKHIGLLSVPLTIGRKYGYSEKDLLDAPTNIYVWCNYINEISATLHRKYPAAWTVANYDFWLSVRLVEILGHASYAKLVTASTATSPAPVDALSATVCAWVTAAMPITHRAGTFTSHSLRRIVDELNQINAAMVLLDGANKTTNQFHRAPEQNPGSLTGTLKTLIR